MPVWVTWRNVSPREDGFPEGEARGKTILPRGDIPSCYPHWHGICVLLYRTNPVCNYKQSKVTNNWWFTHSPLGVASGNGQHEALTDGIRQHDDSSLLSQPITAYDLKVRYNKLKYCMALPPIYCTRGGCGFASLLASMIAVSKIILCYNCISYQLWLGVIWIMSFKSYFCFVYYLYRIVCYETRNDICMIENNITQYAVE